MSKPRRKKKGAVHKAAGWRRVLQILWRVPMSFLGMTSKAVMRYPRFSLLSLSVVLVLAIGFHLTNKVSTYQAFLLPKDVKVDCSDSLLGSRIMGVAKSTLDEARRAKLSRADFLSNLQGRLSNIETLEGSSIRAGLDGHLQISATPHLPLFVVEVQENQRYLISKRMTVLGRMAANEATDLPLIELPDIKPAAKSLSSKEKGNRKTLPPLNLPWLHHVLLDVHEGLKGTDLGALTLEKLIWRNASGFSLRFHRALPAAAPSPVPTEAPVVGAALPTAVPNSLIVILGEADISRKVEKLAQLVRDFAARNIAPEFVDLNFPDKAIIRMKLSDAGVSQAL